LIGLLPIIFNDIAEICIVLYEYFERKGQFKAGSIRLRAGCKRNKTIVEDNIVLDPSPHTLCPEPSARTFP